MSTTVFPVTDQTATAALWQAMASNIDRGSPDPLSGFLDTTQDSVRLQYYGANTRVTTSTVADFETVFTVNVDLGEAWYYEGFLTVSTDDNGDPGDRLAVRITPSSGVNVIGIAYGVRVSLPSSIFPQYINAAGSAQTLSNMIRESDGLEDDEPMPFWFVVFGDTASGSVTFDHVKQTDAHSDNFDSGPRFLIGRRIY